jgi:cytochrome c-type biogenesis protein CcmH
MISNNLPYIGTVLLATLAVAFVAIPLLRTNPGWKGTGLTIGALALVLLGVGIGAYTLVGRPHLALRDARSGDPASLKAEVAKGDISGLAPVLIGRLRANPNNRQDWIDLAEVYQDLGDARDGVAALDRARALDGARHQNDPALQSAYGEMLVTANSGNVTPEAEEAFKLALAGDPHNLAARYYLGLARAMQGDKAGAATLWQSLLDEVPPEAPIHRDLVNRMAQFGVVPEGMTDANGAPDPAVMVASLAARLKANPYDPQGWQMLIRAYAVLGEQDKARQALADARSRVGASAGVKSALDAEAQELKLD